MKKYIKPSLRSEAVLSTAIVAGSINMNVTNNPSDESEILVKEEIWEGETW